MEVRLGRHPLGESGPRPAGGGAVARPRIFTVDDVGQWVQEENMHKVMRRLATCTLASLDDPVTLCQSWRSRLASQMMRERVEAQAV